MAEQVEATLIEGKRYVDVEKTVLKIKEKL